MGDLGWQNALGLCLNHANHHFFRKKMQECLVVTNNIATFALANKEQEH